MHNLREIILTLAKEYNSRVVQYRRDIHMNPELSFKEELTSQYIQSILFSEGIKTISLSKHSSFIAVIDGSGEGKTIGIRAELDALPIQERANVDFASKNDGVMHACGHDIHMASAIGVALIMNKIKEHWNGRVVFVFESGEEQLPGGAMAVLDSAEFKSVMPDMMLGLHVLPEMEAGMVGFCAGRYMASGDEVYLTVKGKGGHAALPHTLIDPVVIASNIILNLQTIVSRSAPALVPTVLSFGKVEANGATNIIPNEVKIEGTFRTMDEAWRGKAHSLIEAKANGIAQSMGGICNVEIRKGYPSVYNNPALTERAKKLAVELLGFDKIVDIEPRMTTDDFAYFSQQTPSVFFRIGVGFPKSEHSQLHSSGFIANEDSLQTSIPLMTWLILNNLK